MTSTEVISSGAGVFYSRAGQRGSQGVPQPGKTQGSTETHQELAALMRVAYSPGMCEARSTGG